MRTLILIWLLISSSIAAQAHEKFILKNTRTLYALVLEEDSSKVKVRNIDNEELTINKADIQVRAHTYIKARAFNQDLYGDVTDISKDYIVIADKLSQKKVNRENLSKMEHVDDAPSVNEKGEYKIKSNSLWGGITLGTPAGLNFLLQYELDQMFGIRISGQPFLPTVKGGDFNLVMNVSRSRNTDLNIFAGPGYSYINRSSDYSDLNGSWLYIGFGAEINYKGWLLGAGYCLGKNTNKNSYYQFSNPQLIFFLGYTGITKKAVWKE